MLHSGNKLERLWFAKVPIWLFRRLPVGSYQFEHKDRAMWALKTLGRAGRAATPDLLAILQDTTEHWNQRYRAMTTLRDIEAEPSVVIPVMDKLRTDPVVGTFAASAARALRDAAGTRRHVETQVPKSEFQPSSSFLDKSSLWGPEKPQSTPINPGSNERSLGTNRPSPPAGDVHSSSTNGSARETDNTKVISR
jgi:hypothetical protein